jgi:hypothetical protein
MSDQPQQPGDAAPSASGEGVPSTGESTSAEDATSTAPRTTGGRSDSTAERAAAEDATTAEPHAGDVKAQQPAGRDDSQAPLFAAEEGDRLRGEWEAVQAAFVDDPRAAVQRAGALVSEVVQNLTESFTTAQSRLEQQWSQGEDVSTEDLRQALHRYRSFFERLLRL